MNRSCLAAAPGVPWNRFAQGIIQLKYALAITEAFKLAVVPYRQAFSGNFQHLSRAGIEENPFGRRQLVDGRDHPLGLDFPAKRAKIVSHSLGDSLGTTPRDGPAADMGIQREDNAKSRGGQAIEWEHRMSCLTRK